MAVNGEGIYATRPWKTFGEGPGSKVKGSAAFNERGRKDLTAEDVRFTTKGKTLYAFVMGWPGKQAVVAPLASKGKLEVGKIRNVELLGYKGKVKWTQDEGGLKVEMPEEKPSDHAVTLKVALG
jgi:alpha-L-fucosidase